MELEPFQKPHPPFWAASGTPEGGEAAGRNGFNMVANTLTPQVRAITDRYRAAFTAHACPPAARALPLRDHGRDRRRGAHDRAPRLPALAPALPPPLPPARHHPGGGRPAAALRPDQGRRARHRGLAATVTRMIKAQMEEAGTNYFVAQFAFGDLTLSRCCAPVDLFARGDAGARALKPHRAPPARLGCRHRRVCHPAMHHCANFQDNAINEVKPPGGAVTDFLPRRSLLPCGRVAAK